jgi:CPA2 family monovalent cation:H+ antiporter-2
VQQARHLAPDVHLIARTRQVEEIDELITCGADEVVAEDFETSIEIATRVLERLRLPTNVVRNAARILRFNQYQALRSPAQRSGLSMTLLRVLSAGVVETFQLEPEHPATGGTIRQTELRRSTGATILAVLRSQKVIPNPDPDLELEAGDTLVLLGSHAALEAARNRLEGLQTSAESG